MKTWIIVKEKRLFTKKIKKGSPCVCEHIEEEKEHEEE
jgi:hypothetical protein